MNSEKKKRNNEITDLEKKDKLMKPLVCSTFYLRNISVLNKKTYNLPLHM